MKSGRWDRQARSGGKEPVSLIGAFIRDLVDHLCGGGSPKMGVRSLKLTGVAKLETMARQVRIEYPGAIYPGKHPLEALASPVFQLPEHREHLLLPFVCVVLPRFTVLVLPLYFRIQIQVLLAVEVVGHRNCLLFLWVMTFFPWLQNLTTERSPGMITDGTSGSHVDADCP